MIDLITVVFRDEIPLLRIQARSIAEYVTSDELNSIIVVVNDSADVADLIDTAWWEQYRDRVKIVPRSFESRITGWESQQLCKLLEAGKSSCKWAVVLDAKTWFIRKLYINDIIVNEKANVGFGRVNKLGIAESAVEFVKDLYNINELPRLIGPGGVPFFFHTETVRNLIVNIDNFPDWFQTNVRYPNLITEFLLYSAYVTSVYGNLDVLYDTTSIPNFIALNIADYEAPDFDKRFGYMQDPKVLTVSLHRKAYTQLTPTQLEQWQQFLIDRKLSVTKFTF